MKQDHKVQKMRPLHSNATRTRGARQRTMARRKQRALKASTC